MCRHGVLFRILPGKYSDLPRGTGACLAILVLTVSFILFGQNHLSPPRCFAGSASLKLAAEDWEFRTGHDSKNAKVQWQLKEDPWANLVLAEGEPGEAYLVSREPLQGDFDVEIGFNLPDWGAPPGGIMRVVFGVGLPDGDGQLKIWSYLLVRETRWADFYSQDRLQGWFLKQGKHTLLEEQATSAQTSFMKLRLSRKNGVVTGYRLGTAPNPFGTPVELGKANLTGWSQVAVFQVPSQDPLVVLLGVGNDELNHSGVFPAVSAYFRELVVQDK
jgi:hypothetical protein